MKRLIRRLANIFGYDIRRLTPASGELPIAAFVKANNIDLVLDVGANAGQWARRLRQGGYSGDMVSFEPVPEVFASLQAAAQSDRRWTVHNLALGEQSGHIKLNVSKDTQYSSILPLTPTAAHHDSNTVVTAVADVSMTTLDEFAAPFRDKKIFLKLDVQGYEPQVLQGATRMMPLVAGIQMELPLIHLYQGGWDFVDGLQFMRNAGFTVSNISPVSFSRRNFMSWVEVDCLLYRA